MKKENTIEWLESTINAMISNGADLGEDLPALMKHIESAKEKYSKDIEGLNTSWANAREQTRQAAERIGFRKCVEAGLVNADDYWEQYETYQDSVFKDDTEFNNDFIDKLWSAVNYE